MGSSQPFESWSNDEVFSKDEDFGLLSFPSTQPLRLDFSGSLGFTGAATDIDHQLDDYHLPIQESAFDAVPMDNFVYDPFYSVLEFEPSPNLLQGGDFCSGDEFREWNHHHRHHHQEMMHFEFNEEANQPLSLCDGVAITSVEEVQAGKKIRKPREVKGFSSSSSTLSRQTISNYFYMPITQAAKELNIGLTLLKKRCRELGIRRWPHRKLMSLQTLIKNVQEMQNGVGGHMAEKKLRETINILENEKKLLEEFPDLELEGQTKRLRQACFKANYKKRKLVGNMESQASMNKAAANNNYPKDQQEDQYYNDDDDEEDLDSIFADCLSSSNSIIYQT